MNDRRLRVGFSTIMAVAFASGSCRPTDVSLRSFATADSSGVEIALSSSPRWGSQSVWRLGSEPSLVIGTALGDEKYSLFRVGRVRRLSDGRIAVANGGTHQIRLFDSTGRHIKDIGRTGDGPGEFRSLVRIWQLPGDSIMAYDGRLSRITVFSPDGELARTLPLRPHRGQRQAFGMRPFRDGELLVDGIVSDELPREGLFRSSYRSYERRSADGEHLNEIGVLDTGREWGFLRGGGLAYTSVPFTPVFPASVGDGEQVYLGAADRFQVSVRSRDGQLRRLIRWNAEQRPVTDAVVTQYLERRQRLYDEQDIEEDASEPFEGLRYPDFMPTYQRLLVDAAGFLWVERYRAPWEESRQWWVFDATGEWLGEAPVPADVDVREVGEDYLLGVRRDDAGVEYVVMYDLARGP